MCAAQCFHMKGTQRKGCRYGPMLLPSCMAYVLHFLAQLVSHGIIDGNMW